MKKILIYFSIFLIYLLAYKLTKADEINVSVNVESLSENATSIGGVVLGTSTGIGDIVGINKVSANQAVQGESLSPRLTLVNRSESDIEIDQIDLIVTKIDGTPAMSEEYRLTSQLKKRKEKQIPINYPNSLAPGDYVGTYNVYSQNKILGSKKTMLTILSTSRVLGASTVNYSYFLIIFGVVIIPALLLLALLFKKRSHFVELKYSFSFFDAVAILAGTSSFGAGLFGVYLSLLLIQKKHEMVVELLICTFVFALVLFSTLVLIKEAALISKTKLNIRLINVFKLFVIVISFVVGFYTGRFITSSLWGLNQRTQGGKSVIIKSQVNGQDNQNNATFVYNKSGLKIYRRPDTGSEVVGELKENGDLKIIDQAAGWYRILLSNGVNGWVEIKDVQKSE
jgi:hypothetical protein